MLVVTSNPDRTSPVKRGLFILSNILGTPAPPPPAKCPGTGSGRERLQRSRADVARVAGASSREAVVRLVPRAHGPAGLAFENFNALGMWREQERKQPIDTAGKLITGETFNSVRELKHLLVTERRADFYRCLTEKLLTYALGRGLEYYDAETVDRIVQRLDQEDGAFSALLMGIIESAPFQKMRTQATAVTADADEPSRKPGEGQKLAENQEKQ